MYPSGTFIVKGTRTERVVSVQTVDPRVINLLSIDVTYNLLPQILINLKVFGRFCRQIILHTLHGPYLDVQPPSRRACCGCSWKYFINSLTFTLL